MAIGPAANTGLVQLYGGAGGLMIRSCKKILHDKERLQLDGNEPGLVLPARVTFSLPDSSNYSLDFDVKLT
jgi:hypothetical protein